MSRTYLMTTGILLVLIGTQLNLVESYVLTPRATQAWNKRMARNYNYDAVPGNYIANSNGYFQGSDAVAVNSPNAVGRNFTTSQPNTYPYSTPSYQQSRNTRNTRTPAYQASYGRPAVNGNSTGPQKMLTPPGWFCWPVIFLGSVLFLFGAATRE